MNIKMTKEFSSTLLEIQRGRSLLITGREGTGPYFAHSSTSIPAEETASL